MSKILKYLFDISYFKTIYINFHYLPFKQAIRLPIIIASRVKLNNLSGKLRLSASPIKFGIIRIGFRVYGFQTQSDKTIIENQGGEIILNENIFIGHGTFLGIGKFGKLVINENVMIAGNSKIICRDEIIIGKNSRIAWEATIIDTDFHETINIHNQERSIGKKPISIGDNNWIGFGTTVLKGTRTPNFCIVGAKSLINKDYKLNEYCFLAGNPAKLIKQGIYRDLYSYIE